MMFLDQIGNTIRVATSSSYDTVAVTLQINSVTVASAVAGRVSSGYYYFAGVEELARAYMEKNNHSIINFAAYYTASKNGSSVSITAVTGMVVYRSVSMRAHPLFNADALVENRFLTPHKTAVVYAGASFFLYYYNTTADVSYSIVRTKRSDGTTVTSTGTASTSGISSLAVSYDSQYSKAVVTMGNRTFTVFYFDIPAGEEFEFRNAFNIEEKVSIPAATTESPKTEFEEAEQGRVRMRYDVENEVEFDVKTGNLPASMYAALLDMCRSRLVNRKYAYTASGTTYTTNLEILIKDYKLEKSNDVNKPISLEMKFVYANRNNIDAVIIE